MNKKDLFEFPLKSAYSPNGDQPYAIDQLTDGIMENKKSIQTLLGVTGSGKTFTIANLISRIKKNTLIISHNKTLAAQLIRNLGIFFHL